MVTPQRSKGYQVAGRAAPPPFQAATPHTLTQLRDSFHVTSRFLPSAQAFSPLLQFLILKLVFFNAHTCHAAFHGRREGRHLLAQLKGLATSRRESRAPSPLQPRSVTAGSLPISPAAAADAILVFPPGLTTQQQRLPLSFLEPSSSQTCLTTKAYFEKRLCHTPK